MTSAGTLDYETSPIHLLTVTVSDGSRTTVITINVIVQNVNEGGPVFGGPYDVTLHEDVPIGTSVADCVAIDPDGDENHLGNPQYSIASGDPSLMFNVDFRTGRVTTRRELDAENGLSPYGLSVKTVEEVGTNSATVTLTVTISDVNDNSPACLFSSFAINVNEDAAVSDVLLTLTCSDDDVTLTSLAYAITSGDTSVFEMAGTNGDQLRLKNTLDYESVTTYPMTISVSDGALTFDVTGTINVGPVNEKPPVFSSSSMCCLINNYCLCVSECHRVCQNVTVCVSIMCADISATLIKHVT